MVDSEGNPFVVEPARVAAAEAQGLRQVTDPAELAALKTKDWGAQHPVLAAAAGAGRSLSFGLTDAAAAGAGYQPELKGLAEGSPGATSAGELGAMLVPVAGELGAGKVLGRAAPVLEALAGPTNLVTKAGRAVEAAAGGGLKGVAARGAAEGAAYGAGAALSESAIEDKPLTGELLLSHVGPAAIFGAGAAGALEKAVGLASRAPGALEAAGAGLEKVATRLEELGPGAATGRAEAALEAARAPIAKVRAEAEAVRREAVTSALGDAGAQPAAAEVAGRLRATIETLPEDTAARATLEKATERLEGRLASARTAAEQVQALEKAASTLATQEALAPAVAHVREALQSEALWGKAGALQREYGARLEALAAAEDAAAPLLKKGGLKAAVQAAAEGDPAPLAAARDWVAKAKDLADHAADVSADLPTGRRNLTQLATIADQLGKTSGAAVDAATPSLLEHAAELLPHGLATVAKTVIAPTRQAEVIAHIMGKAAQASGQIARMARVAIGGAAGKSAPVSSRAAGILSEHHWGTEPKKGETRAQAVARHAQDLQAIAALPPEQLAQRLVGGTSEIGRHAPSQAVAIQAPAVRAVQVLAAAAPKSARAPTGMPGEPTPPPSEVQVAHFERVARAVDRPLTLLEDLHNGRLSTAAVEAVRTVYPALYAHMTEQLTQALAERTERVPYAQRLQLSVLLGRPLDNSLKALGSLQANLQPAPAPAQPQQSAAPGLARPSAIREGTRTATPLNRSSP